MRLKVKKLSESAKIPCKAHFDDIGFDVYADKIEETENLIKVYTGIAVQPEDGYHVELFPRSSIFKKGLVLHNSIGLVDPGYTGELVFVFKKFDYSEPILKEERIGQIVVRKSVRTELVVVDVLLDTSRNDCGFGSTGIF